MTGAAGSVLLFDNRLWHTGGANRSDGPRVGMINVYFPWWLCQDQNMPRGNDGRERLKEETGLRACVSYLQLDRVSIKRCVTFLRVGPKNHELPSRSVLSDSALTMNHKGNRSDEPTVREAEDAT